MIQIPILMCGEEIGTATIYPDGQITLNVHSPNSERIIELYRLALNRLVNGLNLGPDLIYTRVGVPNPSMEDHSDCFTPDETKPPANRYLSNTGKHHHQSS